MGFKMASNQISEDMTIEHVFQLFPSKAQKLSQIMSNAGLNCVGCSASVDETIGDGMSVHGMSKNETNELLGELNKALNEKEAEYVG